MKLTIKLLHFSLCFLALNAFGQDVKLLKSTINSVGINAVKPIKPFASIDSYIIYQSIGQTGNIGTFKSDEDDPIKTHVQQGFLNNKLFLRINNSNNRYFDENLKLSVYPNPFIDHIKINFSDKTSYDIEIFIYDVNGKTHFYKKYDPTDVIEIPMTIYKHNFYFLKVRSGGNSFSEKIFKN
jgi:hypothetical protein